MRDSTIIYRSFFEAISALPKEDRATMWDAVFEYSLNFKEIELTGVSKTIFILIKPLLDANIKNFENGCKPKKKRKTDDKEAKQKPKGSEEEAKDKPSESQTEGNANKDKDYNVNQEPAVWGYSEFVAVINSTYKRQYRGDDKSKRSFLARVKQGFTAKDFIGAIQMAAKDPFHIENKYKYLTPEFFTRTDKLDKFLSLVPPSQERPPKTNPDAKWDEANGRWYVDQTDFYGAVISQGNGADGR